MPDAFHPDDATELPELPPEAPRRFGPVARQIGRTVLRLLGWRLTGRYPRTPKLVVIGAPHTSNWDGVVALATILSLGLDLRLMVKHTLFRGPLGALLRALGAVPVDRRAPGGVVETLVTRFASSDRFVLGIAPEGTRTRGAPWKTGFYRIAVQAGVPILLVALDHGRREVRVGPTLVPSGNLEADLPRIQAFFATARGRHS